MLSSASRLINIYAVELICCALLLVVFCARFWGLGITNTDDGLWALWAHQSDKHPVIEFARDQGRLWGLGGGSWISFGLSFSDSWVGNALIVGSFLLFFALFVRVVSAYWSGGIAFSTAGIFLALFAFRADRSILYAYPLFFWMPASAVITAMLLARRFQFDGGWLRLCLSGLLLLVGLFNNEGADVLSLTVSATALLANHHQAAQHGLDWIRLRKRFYWNGVVYGAIATIFVVASIAWRLHYPSLYSGNTLAPFNVRQIIATLFSFSTSGTILYDLAHPYVATFYDTLLHRAVQVVYAPSGYIEAAAANPMSLISGTLTACLLGRALSRTVVNAPPALAIGVVAGLVIATLPMLPVAMTVQYQSWFYLYDAHAYSHTVFAEFGLALAASCLCGLLLQARRLSRFGRNGIALSIALVLGGLATLGNQLNDAIARDFRPEGARWRVLGDLVTMAAATGISDGTVLVPRFGSGSWFAMMPPGYWSDYARVVLGSKLQFSDHGLTIRDIERGAAYADYQLDRDGRHVTITLAHVAPAADPAAPPVADRMTIMIERPFDPRMPDRVLAYDDVHNGPQQIALRDMMAVKEGMWTVDGIQAVPTSARLLDASTSPRLVVECGASVPLGVPLVAATNMPAGRGCLATGYLKRGWAGPEPTATWSDGGIAVIDLPLEGPPPPKLRLHIDASSYTGLGYYTGLQTIRLRVNGRVAAVWEFRPGGAALPPVEITASDWSPPQGSQERHMLDLEFEINPPFQPKRLGIAADERELGLLLRSILLEPTPD